MANFYCPTTPHFMQPVIRDDFHTNFTIPKSFLKYLEDVGDGKVATLRDRNQYIWSVKLTYHDRVRFGLGWKKFCLAHDIHIGDFVVFKHCGDFTFDVAILEPSGCERPIPKSTYEEAKSKANHPCDPTSKSSNQYGLFIDDEEDEPLQKQFPSFKYEYPHFQYVVKPSNLKNGVILIPIKFARENDLINRWGDMFLTDTKEKTLKMKLRCNMNKADGSGNSYIMCKSFFFKAYGINKHDHLLFELLSNGENPHFKFYRKGE